MKRELSFSTAITGVSEEDTGGSNEGKAGAQLDNPELQSREESCSTKGTGTVLTSHQKPSSLGK
jgi:hypothetical protein